MSLQRPVLDSAEPRARLASGVFYGRSVVLRRVANLVVVDSLHSAGMRVPRHHHEHAYLALIRSGSFTETYGRRRRVAVPGMLLVNPPGEGHSEHMDSCPVSSLNIELSSSWLCDLLELGVPLDRSSTLQSEDVTSLGRRLLSEANHKDPDSGLAIESLTWEILNAALSRHQLAPRDAGPRWLRDIRDLIDGALAPPPALRALAREAGVHPVHFAVVFRRHYGCSLGEYSRRRRLDAARKRVADSGTSLSQIAFDLGFADQSHFTRVYKRYTGMTPQQHRTFLAFKTR